MIGARLGLGLCGLLLLIGGTHLAVAGLFTSQVQRQVEGWEAAAQAPTSSDWLTAHEAARQAVRWYPVANADYLDRLGRVESWKAVGKPFEDAYPLHLAALDDYRSSISVRPNWPYTWVGLAQSKVALQQFDQELDLALTRAFELGPWRQGVNRELAIIGLNTWSQLTPVQRLNTLRSATRAVTYSTVEAQNVLQVAHQNGLLHVVCRSLDAQYVKTIPADCTAASLATGNDSVVSHIDVRLFGRSL